MTEGPRGRAALVFAAAAIALALLWFLPSILARRDPFEAVLFLAAPPLAGALAGWMLGGPLCAPPEKYGPGNAVLTGAAVASLTLLLLSPLYALALLTGRAGSLETVGQLASLGLLMLVALGPVILLVGASVGLFLYRYARRNGRPGGGAVAL